MRRLRPGFPAQQRPDILAVDRLFRQRRPRQGRQSREDINRSRHLPADRPSRDFPGPAHQAGHPDATFPTGPLGLAEGSGTARMIAIDRPRAIITGEDHEGVFIETLGLQSRQDFTHRPVDFLDHIPIQALRRFPFELAAHIKRHVRHGRGDIEEKRLGFVFGDEFHGTLRITRGQGRLIFSRHFRIQRGGIFHQRQRRITPRFSIRILRPHVVGIGQPQIFIESLLHRQQVRMVPQVPLPEHSRGITLGLHHFSKSGFIRIQPGPALWPQRPIDPQPCRITTRQQSRPRRRAHRRRHIKVGKPHPLRRHPVKVGRGVTLRPLHPDVAVALVVGIDHHHIGRGRPQGSGGHREGSQG